MLSSFAYTKFAKLLKARWFDAGIEVVDVNPAYSSKIGKQQYARRYGLSVHLAAALVPARRAQGFRDRLSSFARNRRRFATFRRSRGSTRRAQCSTCVSGVVFAGSYKSEPNRTASTDGANASPSSVIRLAPARRRAGSRLRPHDGTELLADPSSSFFKDEASNARLSVDTVVDNRDIS